MQRLLPCFGAPQALVEQADQADPAPAEPASTAPPAATPVQAWQQRQLTLGFSGGGFLLPYHLGVYQALAIMGLVDGSTPMAGSSAGSMVVASIKSGLSLQQQMDSFLAAAADCRQSGVAGRLRAVLKVQLQRSLPPDAHTRCSDGSCWLSITQVLPRPANKLYGAFATRQALIKALLTSCHLPRLSDGSILTSFKSIHKRCFDGGFSNLVPVPPAPPPAFNSTAASAAAACGVTASTAAAAADAADAGTAVMASLAGVDQVQPTAPAAGLVRSDSTKGISTQLQTGRNNSSSSSSRAVSSHHRLRMAGTAAPAMHHKAHSSNGSGRHNSSSSSSSDPAVLADHCMVAGEGAYVHAPGWFAVRVCVLPAEHLGSLPAMLRAPSAKEVGIAPGKFQLWPHDMNDTTKLALYPQPDDFLFDLFERGRADGLAWAVRQGFPAEVLQRLMLSAVTGVAGESKAAAAAVGDEPGLGVCAGASLVPADAVELPAGLRVARRLASEQQQQMPGVQQQQQQQEAAAVAAAGAEEAAAGVAAAAARQSI